MVSTTPPLIRCQKLTTPSRIGAKQAAKITKRTRKRHVIIMALLDHVRAMGWPCHVTATALQDHVIPMEPLTVFQGQ
ncbi:hypothetical protein DPMN_128648 [Dreissena polymorpha]|uniref:Uncharacterized protein n=1 Tax=Dreissena polymorpha TaxID=45954 RepID=A0A9D4H3J5_DREPO|nr:hypothetical protein DPMN_128648 [Dreissena polymorpha]